MSHSNFYEKLQMISLRGRKLVREHLEWFTRRNGEDVAVKKLKLCDANLNDKQFQTELNNLRKLEHKNIVRILGYCYETEKIPFSKPDGCKVYLEETHRALCFEYLDNGSLQKYLSDELCGLDWHTRFKIIKGTCEGLKYIHEELEAPIYHLDLKPDNILLDKDMIPKIADFGLSRIFNKEQKRITPNPYGTLGYQPPEYIDRCEISGKFDIFSLGVIMIMIMSGSKGYPKCLEMPSDEFIDQVQNNWRNRLQATCSSNSSLEAYCHQIETCTQIALKCVEKDSQKWPNMVTIIEKLNEIETHIGEIKRTDASNDISCQHQNTNLMTGPSRSELDIADAREKSAEVIEELIVGRTEEKRKIMDFLLQVMLEKIVILPIYGIGGIGKTTFARLIYNDPKFKHYSQVWVDVTQRFDLNKILESIISQLSGKESQTNEGHMTRSCPTKIVSGKKILVVLDDLWENDQLQLQELKDMLYHDDNNIIVLVTTRSECVAERICTNLQPYKMLPLTNDMCWDIIKQRSAFEDRDDKKQLMCIGLEIAQKCGGVALAAQSLGFTLRSMNFDQWMEVKDSGIWNEPVSKEVSLPNHALTSLKLSYSYMDPCLKPCFTYCAIFPKGHNIVKNDLVYQWISLDFIKPTKLLSNIQLSEKYIIQLLGLSFFQHSVSPKNVKVYRKGVTVFTMHDLVHDLARLVIGDEILDASKQGSNTGGGRYRFALLNDCSKPLESFTQYPSEIRALRFLESDKSVLHGASSSFSKFLSFRIFCKIGIHYDIFSTVKYLRVLDLRECSVQKLPNSIGNLKQLRYLNASRVHQEIPNCITKLPNLIYLSICGSSTIMVLSESVGEMEGLMYLDLSSCPKIEKLPLSFGKLKELVHLDLSKCSQVTNISESLDRFTNLEYLNLSYCSNIGNLPKQLGSLLQLRNLDLSYSSYIDGRANVAILVSLTKLECLNLASHLSFMENLPEALRRLTNLKYLNLSCVDRDSHGMGQEIRFWNLKNLPECKGVHGILEVLGGLAKLQYLNLSGFSCYVGAKVHLAKMSEARVKITEIGNLNGRARETFATFLECISKLPNLEHLDLSCNECIMRLPYCLGSLGKLHTLNLSQCWHLLDLPANLYEMDSLRFLDLTGCHNVRMPKRPGLNKSLLTLPHFVVQADCHESSSNLFLLQDVDRTDLVISRLENVKSAQEARNINLKEKSRMEKMELNWTKDVERYVDDMEVLGELVPPTTLDVLKIDGYNSVRFPEWFVGSIAFHLPSLVSISMSDLPKCNSLPPLGQLPNLRYLVLKRMNGISEINWELCGSRRAFPQLGFFTLREMESLKVWYTTYSGHRDGVSEFMFPKLSNLEISDCPNLRMKPCPHGAWYFCRIQGRSDGVLSSWESRTSVSACSSARVNDLHIDRCNIPMHQWRLLHHLPGLTTLSISECSNLSCSPEIIRALSSLQKLQVEELPNWLGQLASLEDLTVRCRHEVKPWQDGFPHLTRLRSLCLFEFESMTTVQQWVGSLISLQRLEILGCKNLNDLAESFGCLCSLNELRISVCNRIKSLPDSIARLTSLKRLRIDNCDCITSLPESIGALTSLDKLKIMNCDDITSLPESICGLISLNKLIILHCPGITSLPESIQQLTKLQKLQISAYGELEKWCKTEENKKKLAHIKEKTINTLPF